MFELSIANHDGTLVIDSREVAKAIEMRHSDLLEKIGNYKDFLTNGKFRSLDFFIESTYIDGKGETRPCYLLTRKGCDMVANKMTGEKGVLFTAAYVQRFEEMEKSLRSSMSNLDMLEYAVKAMREIDTRQKEQAIQLEAVNRKVESIGNTIAINPNGWRKSTHNAIVQIAQKLGGNHFIVDVQREIYKLMKDRFAFDVKRRLENRRARMAFDGASVTAMKKLNYLDVISESKPAIEAYVQIVRELCLKYNVALTSEKETA